MMIEDALEVMEIDNKAYASIFKRSRQVGFTKRQPPSGYKSY
jgi:hypothetical protein